MGAVKKEERTEERRNRFTGESIMLTKLEAINYQNKLNKSFKKAKERVDNN